MYSKKIAGMLEKGRIDIGDRLKVVSAGSEFQGILMPRPLAGDQSILVLKLDNGYNIGIKPESVELLAKAKAKPVAHNGDEKAAKGGIAILGCGGTIASKIEYKTGAVYPSITPKELRAAFPALEKWDVHSRRLFSLLSEDMGAHHWRLLADAIEEEIKSGSEGVVVMHGTDTMNYTAAAVSYMLQKLPVPVVLVGAQRSADRPSSENEMNLLNAVFSASQDLGEVTVCMHASTSDDYCHLHRGTRVRKMHTSRRDAFRSIGASPLFTVDYRAKRFEQMAECRKRSKAGMLAQKELNDNVAMIYAHPNIKASLISGLSNYDGVVLVGTGLGHVPANAFEDNNVHGILKPIKELVDSGIPVVMSSQCVSGRICMRIYSTGRLLMDAGVIGDGADWTPEAAYVKLCWALGQAKGVKEIEKLMMTDIAGEITSRSSLGEL